MKIKQEWKVVIVIGLIVSTIIYFIKRKKSANSDNPSDDGVISNVLPNNVKNLMDKLKDDWEVEITQNHIDKEFAQEGQIREDSKGVNKQAEQKILELIKACKTANKTVSFPSKSIISSYRSYNDQVANFGKKVKIDKRTIEDVQSYNCLPGFSQHHTGKAFDIFSTKPDWWNKNLKVKKWVEDNCEKYGFVLPYKNKGVLRNAEAWHLFYNAN